MAQVKEGFSTGAAARLTGVSFRNIDFWARTKFIVPSIADAKGTGTERRYAFADLVALRMARDLREAGVSTQALRRVMGVLRKNKSLVDPPAECRLIVFGSDVYVATNSEEAINLLSKPGQTTFAFIFDLARTAAELISGVKSGYDASSIRKPPARELAPRFTSVARNRRLKA